MENVRFALDGAWQVLAVGLLLGAGLPAVFALGIRSLALGQGGDAETAGASGEPRAPHPVGRLLAGLCFAAVVAVVALGITVVVASGFGKEVTLAHGLPTLTDKA